MNLKLDKSTWKRVAFGDVVKNLNVTVKDPEAAGIDRIIAMEHLDPSELKINRWGCIEDSTTFTRRVKPGQTLFGKRRAYQRKAAYAEFDAITSGDILVFEADETQLLPTFLPFLVQSDGFFDHALGTSAGSLSPRTNWRDLANYEFDLPPLGEQKRLADLLWAVEHHGEAALHERECLLAAREAWLNSQVDQLLKVETISFEKVWASSPESGWSPPPVDVDTGNYVLSLSALGPEGYRSGHLKNVQDSTELRATRLAQGDLLISRANTLDAVGRVGIYSDPRDDVSFPDTMMRLHLLDDIRSEFAEAVLSSRHGRAHMRRTAAGSATSMVKINRQSLGRFPFPRPSTRRQDQLVDELRRFSDALGSLDRSFASTNALERSVSAQAFGGVE